MNWFIIALGSNRRGPWGSPEQAVRRALELLGPVATSRLIHTPPIGPSSGRFINAVAIVETDLNPPQFLTHLKSLERNAGRRRGQRWGARALDLDIIGWSGGIHASPCLSIPHAAFRQRRFVLAPLTQIAADWRDPISHQTARQLLARLDRKRPQP